MHKYKTKKDYLNKYLLTKNKVDKLIERMEILRQLQMENKKINPFVEIESEIQEFQDRINKLHKRELSYKIKLNLVIKDLPEPFYEVLQLKFIGGLPFDQIAKRIGYSERTARKYYSKGMDLLDEKDIKSTFIL